MDHDHNQEEDEDKNGAAERVIVDRELTYEQKTWVNKLYEGYYNTQGDIIRK